jgi:hypothetical protein
LKTIFSSWKKRSGLSQRWRRRRKFESRGIGTWVFKVVTNSSSSSSEGLPEMGVTMGATTLGGSSTTAAPAELAVWAELANWAEVFLRADLATIPSRPFKLGPFFSET